jgi:anti-sigma regulatory factor (Ser/Thr protein kinase)
MMADSVHRGRTASGRGPGELEANGVVIYERLLPAVLSSVPRIRSELGAVLEFCALDAGRRSDIGLFVTEAAANVVRHAYLGGTGALYAFADVDKGWLDVAVSDWGHGLASHPGDGGDPATPARETAGAGLGLGLMSRLADVVRIDSDESGTDVEGSFELTGTARFAGPSADVRNARGQMLQEYLRVLQETNDTVSRDAAALIAEAQQAVAHSRERRRARRAL